MIQYIKGDLFAHITDPMNTVIAHVVNNKRKWGAGFTKALSEYDGYPEEIFRKSGDRYELGDNQYCFLKGGLIVVNMFAQDGVGRNKRRVRYSSLVSCINGLVNDTNLFKKTKTLLCPMLGCGLGGGDPIVVKALLEDFWGKAHFNVKVFSL